MTLPKHSNLDDPEYARFAWGRYWRLMRGMAWFAAACAVAAMALLYIQFGMVSIHMYIAVSGGVIATVMLGAALMGLVFLSSGSGHDESIHDPLEDERPRDE